jgi:hypothetical protein
MLALNDIEKRYKTNKWYYTPSNNLTKLGILIVKEEH